MYTLIVCIFFFFKQKTAYEMRISDWSSDVCSSDLNLFSESAIHSCWERLRFTRSLVETVTSLTPSSPSFSLAPPLKIQKEDRMRPPPATPARSSRCFLRTASFPARSPESGETPSPVPPSRGGRLRFKKSDRAMSSPLCLRVLGVLGDKVGRSDLARGEPALGNRH